MRRLHLLVALLVALAAPTAGAQNNYEQMYGAPVDVSLADLIQNPSAYDGRSVRTHGRLEMVTSSTYQLSEGFGGNIGLVPTREVTQAFRDEAPRLLGLDVEVKGLFTARGASSSMGGSGVTGMAGSIQFWSFLGPPEKNTKAALDAMTITLEQLVREPGTRDGQTVRVVGQFRGKNLFGDLPSQSERGSTDWVIKADLYAVWVVGKKPKGPGWELDAGLKRDTGKWLEVIGKAQTLGGVTYLAAQRVNLTTAPAQQHAEAVAPTPPPERPKQPPVVVFALPLDGETDISRNSHFVVQFSKDMDEATFAGHVVLRYSGPRRAGDRAFDSVKMSYDGGRRALAVDPGDLLRPGRKVELLLLSGILDIDGLPLTPRAGNPSEDVVDVLTFQVGL